MKKIILILLAVIIAVSVSAQDKFSFGPKVGFSFSDLHADHEETNDRLSGLKAGLTIGAFAEYRAIRWFSVSADVLFTQKGSKGDYSYTSPEISMSSKNNIKLNYIDIPVLANFYVTKRLALKAGIQPEFLVGAKHKITEEQNGETQKETVDLKDVMKTCNFSIPVGISYTFKMGFVVDLRYHIGCTDLLKDGEYKLTNRVATLTVGWKF